MPESGAVLDHVNLDVLHSSAQIPDFFEWLGRRRDVLGVDTESGGLDHLRHRLRMVQFGDLHQGWAIPWHRWSGVAVEALRRYQGPLVLHNTPHDAKFLLEKAPEIGPWPWDRTNDTLTIAHLVDPLRSKNLKAFAAFDVDPSAAIAQKSLDEAMAVNHWTWDTVPWDFHLYWAYAAMDPVLTCHVFDKRQKEIIHGAPREAYGLEIGTLRVVTNMMRKGALVDLQYCQEQVHKLGAYAQQIKEYLAQTFKITSVWGTAQFAQAFDALDAEILPKRTSGGKQSWDKEVLESINHDLARYILGVRKIEKQLGPYFRNFQRMADHEGRVHPTIWSMGTRTGRQTVTDPALQTLPKKDPTIRGAFIPAPGFVLITIDADQIEARLAAHFSGDRGMIEAFNGTDDFFVAMARRIFQDEALQKDDLRRQLTKNTIYGDIYGAGVAKMATTSRVSLDQMQAFVLAFDEMFPGIKQLQNTINQRGSQRMHAEGEAYVITPYGRRLPSDDDKEYALLNYLIQGHASEILKRCLVELDLAGFGDYMILPVHDEIVMEVPEELAEEVLRKAEEIMNDYTNYAVPITWSGEILKKSWGERYAHAA